MNFLRSYKLLLTLFLLLASWGLGQVPPPRWGLPELLAEETPATQEELPSPSLAPAEGAFYVGTASCAASNCHGGGNRPAAANEDPLSPQAYSIWIQKDPHSRAYSTLFNAASRRMAEKLAVVKEGDPSGRIVPAHENQACLNCHTLNPPADQLATPHRFTISDGVGCEACHGPAGKWIETHTRPTWQGLSSVEKQSQGFTNLKDLVRRGETCIDCHIGGPGRDVNHDLIAAGHPRLNFELAAFHASMPKHWRQERAEQGDLAKVEARLLLTGQVLSSLAALEQLDRRAEQAQASAAPWPEFAEYDCYACHHQLSSPSRRPARDPAQHRAGEYPWGTWNLALLPGLAGETKNLPKNLATSLQNISQAMSVPYPDEKMVIAAVREARLPLVDFLAATKKSDLSNQELQATLSRLTSEEQLAQGGSWEIEAQRYLAASSLFQSLSARAKQSNQGSLPAVLIKFQAELEKIRTDLAFADSAQNEEYSSPQAYDSVKQQKVLEAFQRIHQLFPEP